MSYFKETIDNLEAIDYGKYESISSYEKLMLYAALILEEKNVPLTFNYLCIASFKLFPDKFCCDEEFREFPSVDRLNRTMMHLKYVKGKQGCLVGTISDGYSFTTLGRQQALMVREIINGSKNAETTKKASVNKNKPVVDKHKLGPSKYKEFTLNNPGYKAFLETGEFDEIDIYDFFDVTPFSQIPYIKKTLSTWLEYAKDNNDTKCIEYINKFLSLYK